MKLWTALVVAALLVSPINAAAPCRIDPATQRAIQQVVRAALARGLPEFQARRTAAFEVLLAQAISIIDTTDGSTIPPVIVADWLRRARGTLNQTEGIQ